MAKKNYTKVEEALSDGLLKIKREALLKMADDASKQKRKSSSIPSTMTQEDSILIKFLQIEFKGLIKMGQNPYKLLGIKKSEFLLLTQEEKPLTKEEKEKLSVLKEKLIKCKEKLAENLPSDEEIVEQQSKDQINKRFNVKDDWLPLD